MPTQEQIEFRMRTERNMKLGESDFSQLADAPLTTAEKAEWATYRQTLRDWPDTWPTELTDENIPAIPLSPYEQAVYDAAEAAKPDDLQ